MAIGHATDLLAAAEQALASIPLPLPTSELPSGAQPIRWEELDGTHAIAPADGLSHCPDKTLELRLELGRTRVAQHEQAKLRTGCVVPLDNRVGDLLELYAGDRMIGRGEPLVLDGKLGIRVVELFDQ